MSIGKRVLNVLPWVGIFLLQLVMTQVVTFGISLLIPDLERFQQGQPVLFAAIVGVTFSAGVFLAGWLAIQWGWLKAKPRYLARLAATLIGAALPLILGLVVYHVLEAGNPAFFASILTSILGFHLPGWMGGK